MIYIWCFTPTEATANWLDQVYIYTYWMLIIFNWILDNRNPSQFSESEPLVLQTWCIFLLRFYLDLRIRKGRMWWFPLLSETGQPAKTIIVHRELFSSSCNIYLGFCQIKKRTGNTENHGQVLPVFNALLFCISEQDCEPDMSSGDHMQRTRWRWSWVQQERQRVDLNNDMIIWYNMI